MKTMKSVAAAGAVVLAVPLIAALAAAPAVAAAGESGDVVVTNTETIQAYLDSSGNLDVARIYDQIAMEGKGTVDLKNPVETQGLRNLDEFGGFEVQNGQMVGTYEVDGQQRLRSVSDYPKKLPLDVDVIYTWNGKRVDAGDVVGENGTLGVQYTVRNMTGTPTEVSYDDGTGTTVTTTEDVVIPMVGSLTTVLPPNFTDVRSAEANMAGDGRGGTKMSFTMTLFGPIGKPEATFGYTAKVTDGVIPKASISALPVSPLDSPSFKGGAASYKSGAETGATLTAGATQIDANLLRLRDGAGELLAGLIKLHNGAQELNTGLADTAVPGADALAAGADKAAAGADELNTGLGALDDGANQLAGGAADAAAGANTLAGGSAQVADGLVSATDKAPALIDGLAQVAGGLDLLDAGLVKLFDGIGNLPASAAPLHEGIVKLRAGIGSKTDSGTLVYGVNAVNVALATSALPGIDKLIAGAFNTDPKAPGSYQKLDCAQRILTDVIEGTYAPIGGNGRAGTSDACYFNASTNPDALVPLLQGLSDTPNFLGSGQTELSETVTTKVRDSIEDGLSAIVADPSNPTTPNETTLVGGLSKLRLGLDAHAPGTYGSQDPGGAQYALTAVNCGLDNTTSQVCDSTKPGLMQGLGTLDAGISQLVNGVVATVQGAVGNADDTSTDNTLRGGVHSLQAGVDQLEAGGAGLVLGLDQLSYGAGLVAEGNADLSVGLALLSGGADAVASGTGQASDGASQLADGNQQIADGANKLADGLGAAADGSGQLSDGLGQAAEGAPALEDGAQRLSDEGTKKLVEAGKATAADYGLKYALIEAGAQRASSEGMAYGAPANAIGATAYSLELAAETGEAKRNASRLLLAAVAFALAGGALLLRRRMV